MDLWADFFWAADFWAPDVWIGLDPGTVGHVWRSRYRWAGS